MQDAFGNFAIKISSAGRLFKLGRSFVFFICLRLLSSRSFITEAYTHKIESFIVKFQFLTDVTIKTRLLRSDAVHFHTHAAMFR